MELTPDVAASGVFVTCCYAKYIFLSYYLLYEIFNEHENGVLQCTNIDLETMIKSLRLIWPRRIINSYEVLVSSYIEVSEDF